MKKCEKCGYENSDESKFCEECGSQELTPTSEAAEGVAVGDNSAISAGELISGGKNNTTNNTSTATTNTTNTDNSSSTHISHGASAEDMANILKVVMQENSNVIKQVLEHQQQQVVQQVVAPAEPQPSNVAEEQGGVSAKSRGDVAAKDEPSEYDLVVANLYNTIMSLIGRLEALRSPDKGYFLRKYYFVMWIAATVFFFFMAAATAIGFVWIAVIASLAMAIFTAFRRFKSSDVEPKRVELDGCLKEYAEIRATIISAIGEDNDIVRLSQSKVDELRVRFESAERSAKSGAVVTTAVVCGALFVLGALIVNIVIG